MTERDNYIRHIKRLRLENKVLRSVVAEERLRRQAAFGWYIKRLRSFWMNLFYAMVFRSQVWPQSK